MRPTRAAVWVLLGVLLAGEGWMCLPLSAQVTADLQGSAAASGRLRGFVSYVPEPATVEAGRRSIVELHFRVAPGYHINSHTPKSELLIPTMVTFDAAGPGVSVGSVDYPTGAPYTLPTDKDEVLDVYTGAVTVRLPVTATAGEHLLQGTLHYQACDRAVCYPPKTLAIMVPLTAR